LIFTAFVFVSWWWSFCFAVSQIPPALARRSKCSSNAFEWWYWRIEESKKEEEEADKDEEEDAESREDDRDDAELEEESKEEEEEGERENKEEGSMVGFHVVLGFVRSGVHIQSE
jgi:hypothetical protein